MAPAAIRWYETLFFNVRDRLQATGWIRAMLTRKHRWQGLGDPFAIQFLCNVWGPKVLDLLLYGVDPGDRPRDQDQPGACVDRGVSRSVRRQSLLSCLGGGLDGASPLALMEEHLRLMEIDAKPAEGGEQGACFDRAVAHNVRRQSLLSCFGGGLDRVSPLALVKQHVRLMQRDAKRAKAGEQIQDSPQFLAMVDGLIETFKRILGTRKPCKDRSAVPPAQASAERPKKTRTRADASAATSSSGTEKERRSGAHRAVKRPSGQSPQRS
jgi:hypothetical protein